MPIDSAAHLRGAVKTGLDCHALVIGVNAYGNRVRPLSSACTDATVLTELLRSAHGYAATCFLDEQASGRDITQYLSVSLPPRLSEESAFLFYFAGHGVAVGDGTEGPQGYLLPQDAKAGDEQTWLSMETLRGALEALPCRHLLVVLDCCFAGAFRWASTREALYSSRPLYDSQFQRFLQGDAWQALTSAAHDQRAADVMPGRSNWRDAESGGGHSPFAAALIRALSGDADSARVGHEPDGVITATELHQFLFEELVPQGEESGQIPGIWPLRPDNTGEYVFLNPAAALNTVPDPPLDDANNPWLGLKAYSAGEADLFFGRQKVVDKLLERVLDERAPALIAVVGASGTGKSSVVKAGLLPLLNAPADARREHVGEWNVVQAARLGAEPLQQLDAAADALPAADANRRRLLLIDQFEELYTQCPDRDARADFLHRLRSLIDAADGLRIVITLRSDFEPRLAGSHAIGDLLPAARYPVPAFSSEEVRDIIEGPASVKALFFDPATLVGELIDEVAAMPGALPLLSFALAEMYRHAQRRRRDSGDTDRALTMADYRATGGVVGAVHLRATRLFEQADSAQQQTIRRIFLRLLSQDGARLARRRVHTSELDYEDPEEQRRVDAVVRSYVEARLLLVDGEFVEPAHDTLIVAWEKLQEWLAASGSQQTHRALWRDASDWLAHDRDSGFLWDSDPRRPQVEAQFDELNALEQTFVTRSVARKKRRLRLAVGITASVIAALSGITVWALISAAEARKQARIARAGQLVAESRNLQGAQLEVVRRKALLAAEAVARLGADGLVRPEANRAMADAAAWLPQRVVSFDSQNEPPVSAFSVDGLSLFRVQGKKLQRWNLHTAALEHEVGLDAEPADLVVGTEPDQVGVLDRADRFTLWAVTGSDARREAEALDGIACAAINGRHTKLAVVKTLAGSPTQEVQVRRLPGLDVLQRFDIPTGARVISPRDIDERCLEFSPHGAAPEVLLSRFVYTDEAGYETPGTSALRLPSGNGEADPATAPHDGTLDGTAAGSSPPGERSVWHWREGERIRFASSPYALVELHDDLTRIRPQDWARTPMDWGSTRPRASAPRVVSPMGTRFVTVRSTGDDPYVPLLRSAEFEIRDGQSGWQLAEVPGGGVSRLRFTHDGKTLMTVDGALLRFWSADRGVESYRINARVPVEGVTEARGGRFVALRGEDNSLDVWSTHHPQEILRMPRARGSLTQLSGNGQRLAVSTQHGVRVVDVASAALVADVPAPTPTTSIRWSADATLFAVLSAAQATVLRTQGDATPVWTGQAVLDVVFSPDAKSMAVIGTDRVLIHYGLPDASPRWRIENRRISDVAFAGDGRTIVARIDGPPAGHLLDCIEGVRKNCSEPATLTVRTSDGHILRSVSGRSTAVALDHDGQRLAIAHANAGTGLYSMANDERTIELTPPETVADTFGLAFAADNRLTMLTGSAILGGHSYVREAALTWNLTSERIAAQIPESEATALDYLDMLAREDLPQPTGMVYSTDGRYVGATVFPSQRAYWQVSSEFTQANAVVWDMSSPRPREVFRRSGAQLQFVAAGNGVALLQTEDAYSVWRLEPGDDPSSVCERVHNLPEPTQLAALVNGETQVLRCPRTTRDKDR